MSFRGKRYNEVEVENAPGWTPLMETKKPVRTYKRLKQTARTPLSDLTNILSNFATDLDCDESLPERLTSDVSLLDVSDRSELLASPTPLELPRDLKGDDMRYREAMFLPDPLMMQKQKHIHPHMRATLVDWLIEVTCLRASPPSDRMLCTGCRRNDAASGMSASRCEHD